MPPLRIELLNFLWCGFHTEVLRVLSHSNISTLAPSLKRRKKGASMVGAERTATNFASTWYPRSTGVAVHLRVISESDWWQEWELQQVSY